jgi:hypothetical protein
MHARSHTLTHAHKSYADTSTDPIAHTRARARTHARTHAHTRTHRTRVRVFDFQFPIDPDSKGKQVPHTSTPPFAPLPYTRHRS